MVHGSMEGWSNLLRSNLTMKFFSNKFFFITILILVLLIFGAAIYFSFFAKGKQGTAEESFIRTERENKKLIDVVGEFVYLPSGETPVIATVNDRKKLNKQLFFKKAEEGDKVIFYTNKKTAVLYRPSINKIISFATQIDITFEAEKPAEVGSASGGLAN